MNQFTVSDIETIAENIPGAEGIAISNDGRIFIGAEDGWIYVITPDGDVSQYVKLPGRPLGIAIDRQDNLFVCDWDAHGVYKVTPNCEVSLFADSDGTHKMQFPNFCVFDDQGNLCLGHRHRTKTSTDTQPGRKSLSDFANRSM